MAVLQQIHQENGEIYIILDALDDCSDRFGLLNIIGEIHSRKLGNLHFLVTNRKEEDIRGTFESFMCCGEEISTQSALVDKDIRACVQERLSKDRRLRRWQMRLEVQEKIENALMEKADGM